MFAAEQLVLCGEPTLWKRPYLLINLILTIIYEVVIFLLFASYREECGGPEKLFYFPKITLLLVKWQSLKPRWSGPRAGIQSHMCRRSV